MGSSSNSAPNPCSKPHRPSVPWPLQWGSKCFLPLGQWPLISQTGEAELLFHVLFPSGPMLVTKFYLFPLGCVAWGCIKKYNVEKSRR